MTFQVQCAEQVFVQGQFTFGQIAVLNIHEPANLGIAVERQIIANVQAVCVHCHIESHGVHLNRIMF